MILPYGDGPLRGHLFRQFPIIVASRQSEQGHGETNVALELAAAKENVYLGFLPRLVDSVDYQVYCGDAWTSPARLVVVPLPMVDVQLVVTPPDYVRDDRETTAGTTGLRSISVIEGSQVEVRLTSDKRLREATFSIEGKTYAMTILRSRRKTAGRLARRHSAGGGRDRSLYDPGDRHRRLQLAKPIRRHSHQTGGRGSGSLTAVLPGSASLVSGRRMIMVEPASILPEVPCRWKRKRREIVIYAPKVSRRTELSTRWT